MACLVYLIQMKIQLITINTWKCDGEYYKRMRVLANDLKKLTPHIIACQECFLSQDETIDTLRFLAEELDMYYHFTPARFKERLLNGKPVSGYSGIGVLSAFQLNVREEFDLPTRSEDGERHVQQTEIKLSTTKKLLLTNVHLTHSRNAADLRKQQLEVISQKTLESSCDYNLVCGDFNTTLQSEELAWFIAQTNAVDTYEAGEGKEPRTSINNNEGICVDHIFSLPTVKVDAYSKFTNAGVVLNKQGENDIYPSDHFGISTTLVIN